MGLEVGADTPELLPHSGQVPQSFPLTCADNCIYNN
jgi:hypothetical protein